MPNFFDKNNLTQEQKLRWDSVSIEYEKIQEFNLKNNFNSLTEENKASLMNEIESKSENDVLNFVRLLNQVNSGRDEKSALFNRLLKGNKALIYPPPCSFSYPWYDVIENNGPWEIANIKYNSHSININQTEWKVLNIISSNEILITYSKWEDLGFMWKLKFSQVSYEKTSSFLSSFHGE